MHVSSIQLGYEPRKDTTRILPYSYLPNDPTSGERATGGLCGMGHLVRYGGLLSARAGEEAEVTAGYLSRPAIRTSKIAPLSYFGMSELS